MSAPPIRHPSPRPPQPNAILLGMLLEDINLELANLAIPLEVRTALDAIAAYVHQVSQKE